MSAPTKKQALEMRQGRGTQTLEIIAKIRIIGEVFTVISRNRGQPKVQSRAVTQFE
jgi:hypothetical protein